jgi:hypothetical protein
VLGGGSLRELTITLNSNEEGMVSLLCFMGFYSLLLDRSNIIDVPFRYRNQEDIQECGVIIIIII